jgi:hypothetical protein
MQGLCQRSGWTEWIDLQRRSTKLAVIPRTPLSFP